MHKKYHYLFWNQNEVSQNILPRYVILWFEQPINIDVMTRPDDHKVQSIRKYESSVPLALKVDVSRLIQRSSAFVTVAIQTNSKQFDKKRKVRATKKEKENKIREYRKNLKQATLLFMNCL